jgi:hypothetical protein
VGECCVAQTNRVIKNILLIACLRRASHRDTTPSSLYFSTVNPVLPSYRLVAAISHTHCSNSHCNPSVLVPRTALWTLLEHDPIHLKLCTVCVVRVRAPGDWYAVVLCPESDLYGCSEEV